MHIVIIEWDGKKPPTTYYNRLRWLSLRVRGEDRMKTPIIRRAGYDPYNGERAVVLQEGAIMCRSKSLANTVAALAVEHGAEFVAVGEFDAVEYGEISPEDAKALARINAVAGRRGKPSEVAVLWTVMCLEEGKTYVVKNTSGVATCPKCNSTRFKARPGKAIEVALPNKGATFDKWLRTRFASGVFEVPLMAKEHPLPPVKSALNLKNEKEKKVLELFKNAKDVFDRIDMLEKNQYWTRTSVTKSQGDYPDMSKIMEILDAIFIARTFYNYAERTKDRIRAAIKLFQKGVHASAVEITEKPDELDILDAAIVYGPVSTANLWLVSGSEQVIST